MNGDGFQDVILLDDSQFGYVQVRLGNGDGTFQAIRSFPLGLFAIPTEVGFGDVNHDGKVDLAVASISNTTGEVSVSILLGNGDGTFQPRVILTSVGAVIDVVLTDLDQDGNVDLILGGNQNAVLIRLGNGDGTFQNSISVPLPGTSYQIEVRDFNGDGKLDLAALQPGIFGYVPQIYVALNRGDGSFLPAVTYGTTAYTLSMTSGDVNGDGYLDLITGAEWAGLGDLGGSITVHLGTGDGTFQPAVRYGIYPRGYYDVITADIDNDGHLDIVAAAQSGDYRPFHIPPTSVAVLYNHGEGTFGDPVFYDHAGVTIGKIAVADFNGDHLPDILTSNAFDNTFSIIFGVRPAATRGSQHRRCGHCRQRRAVCRPSLGCRSMPSSARSVMRIPFPFPATSPPPSSGAMARCPRARSMPTPSAALM